MGLTRPRQFHADRGRLHRPVRVHTLGQAALPALRDDGAHRRGGQERTVDFTHDEKLVGGAPRCFRMGSPVTSLRQNAANRRVCGER